MKIRRKYSSHIVQIHKRPMLKHFCNEIFPCTIIISYHVLIRHVYTGLKVYTLSQVFFSLELIL